MSDDESELLFSSLGGQGESIDLLDINLDGNDVEEDLLEEDLDEGETEVLFSTLKNFDRSDKNIEKAEESEEEVEVLFTTIKGSDMKDDGVKNDDINEPIQVEFVGLELEGLDDEISDDFINPLPADNENNNVTEKNITNVDDESDDDEEEPMFQLGNLLEDVNYKSKDDKEEDEEEIVPLASFEEEPFSPGPPISPLVFKGKSVDNSFDSTSSGESTDTTSSEEEEEGYQPDDNISLLYEKKSYTPPPSQDNIIDTTPPPLHDHHTKEGEKVIEEEEEDVIVTKKTTSSKEKTKTTTTTTSSSSSSEGEEEENGRKSSAAEEVKKEKPQQQQDSSIIGLANDLLSLVEKEDQISPQKIISKQPKKKEESLQQQQQKKSKRLNKHFFKKLEKEEEKLQRPPSVRKDGGGNEEEEEVQQTAVLMNLQSAYEFEGMEEEGMNVIKANCTFSTGPPLFQTIVSLYDSTIRIFDSRDFSPMMIISKNYRKKTNPLLVLPSKKKKKSIFRSTSEDGDDLLESYRGPGLPQMMDAAAGGGGGGSVLNFAKPEPPKEKSLCTDIIKWDKKVFLCGFSDGVLVSYSHKTYEKVTEFPVFCEKADCSVLRLCKLNKTSFLCLYKGHVLCVISYPKRKVINRLEKERLTPYTQIEMSTTFRKCFYINTGDKSKSVKLVHHESGVVLNRFSNHRSVICTMKSIKSNKNFKKVYKDDKMELLLVGGYTDSIYVYRSRNILLAIDPQSKKLRRNRDDNAEVIMKIAFPSYVYSTLMIKNRYLVFGDGNGVCHVYDTNEKLNVPRKVCEMKVHKSFIFDLVRFEDGSSKKKKKDDLGLFLSFSDDRRVKVISLEKNLLFGKKKKKKKKKK